MAGCDPATLWAAGLSGPSPHPPSCCCRYTSKAAFTDVHRTSPAYLAFKEQQTQWRADHAVEVTGRSYYETGLGHMLPQAAAGGAGTAAS